MEDINFMSIVISIKVSWKRKNQYEKIFQWYIYEPFSALAKKW